MNSAVATADLPNPIRVMLVDDEPMFVEMVQALLEVEEGIEVVGKAPDGRRAVELAPTLQPDVIVMDISMPVLDGLAATREIRQQDPSASVLILTGGSNITDVDTARKAGASGYLTKDRIARDLLVEIRNLGSK
jgi:DNA-binding NarL/FixJ family response regulator